MFLEYPSFSLSVEFNGETPGAYLFMVTLETPRNSITSMIMIGPPPGGYLHSVPPEASFAAAGHKVVSDMRRLLAEGVEKFVDYRMRDERRVSRRDLVEATELATETLDRARSVDERDLAEAEKDTARKIETGGIRKKRPRTGMGGTGRDLTTGGRRLAQDGFIDIHEISLVGKGAGLWYEATEPPPAGRGPHDWSPRADPRERVLLLRQGPGIWHVFYTYSATSSGSDPRGALKGGLGDAISTDAELIRYCDLILAAPRRLAEDYTGLYEAQGQCYEERRQKS